MDTSDLGPGTTDQLLQDLTAKIGEAGVEAALQEFVASLDTLRSNAAARLSSADAEVSDKVAEWNTQVADRQVSAADEMQTIIDGLRSEATNRIEDLKNTATEEQADLSSQMEGLLKKLKESYGFTTRQVLGGGHEIAANAERDLAESHGRRSRWSMWIAVGWTGLVQVGWWCGWAPAWDQWFDALRSLPVVGGPVVILLFVAKREGRIASDHRRRHERLKNLELQFRSWDPYLQTLQEGVRQDLERQITPKFFPGDVAARSGDQVDG